MKVKDMPVSDYRKMCKSLDNELAYGVNFILEAEGWDTLKDLTPDEFVEFMTWYDRNKWDYGEKMCALQDAGKPIMEVYDKYHTICDVEFYDYEMGDEVPDDIPQLVAQGIFADVGWAYVCLA